MRKTSKDTGDTVSVNSGVENDIRKSDISTKKRNSIKKKVQSFSHESDDAALVPLLLTYKDKPEIAKQSAKYTLSKTKTDSINEEDEKEDILKNIDKDIERGKYCKSVTSAHNILASVVNERSQMLDSVIVCSPTSHVFGNINVTSSCSSAKTSLFIEMNNKTSNNHNANALIFTTAKIHTDSKSKAMDSIQVTTAPILSTVEGKLMKPEVTPISSNISTKPDGVKNNFMKTEMSEFMNDPSSKKGSIIPRQMANEMIVLDKSSLNIYDDKMLERNIKEISKTLANTKSTPLSSYSDTTGISKDHNNQLKLKPGDDTKTVTKTDIQNTKDEIGIGSKITNDNKKPAGIKLENTSSLKKLQRQKHTAIEESNNLNISHTESKKSKDSETKTTKTEDTPNTNSLKANGSMQTDSFKRSSLSTVQTKIVKTCPITCTSETEKIATISTTAPVSKSVTTVKSITTGAINSNKEPMLNSSSLVKSSIDNVKELGTGSTKPSTSTSSVKLITVSSKDNKDETKDLVTKTLTPITSTTASTSIQPSYFSKLPQSSSIFKIDNTNKSSPTASKIPTTVGKTLPINKTKSNSNMESEMVAINLQEHQTSLASTSSNNIPVSTPLYIVATSKTKIGGTPTSNTAGISKAQIDQSITHVVSTVKTTPTAISKPASTSTSGIDSKIIDSKNKQITLKPSLKK